MFNVKSFQTKNTVAVVIPSVYMAVFQVARSSFSGTKSKCYTCVIISTGVTGTGGNAYLNLK